MDLRQVLLCHVISKEQVVQRTERSILFHLVDGHFFTIHLKFDEASPTIKLMGTDFADIFGITIRTSQ